jgi:hypothetical protein
VPPELVDCEEARNTTFAHLHGVCNPVLLEPALAPLPEPPASEEIYTSGTASDGSDGRMHPADILAQAVKKAEAQKAARNQGNKGQPRNAQEKESPGRGAMPRPVDLRVPAGAHVAAVTGPNTGGKTAALKTLGISAAMSQAGLYLRLHPDPDAEDTQSELDTPKVLTPCALRAGAAAAMDIRHCESSWLNCVQCCHAPPERFVTTHVTLSSPLSSHYPYERKLCVLKTKLDVACRLQSLRAS